MPMSTAHDAAQLAGRLLLALLFILEGVSKLRGYTGAAAYMSAFGIPGALLPLVIVTFAVTGFGT